MAGIATRRQQKRIRNSNTEESNFLAPTYYLFQFIAMPTENFFLIQWTLTRRSDMVATPYRLRYEKQT